jgi:hypothetical protein
MLMGGLLALIRIDLSSFIFLSELFKSKQTSSLDYHADMELDPTKNDNLHVYIWENLMKRIKAETAR